MSLNLIPHTSSPLAELLTGAAFAPLDNVGWIRVTGEDRVRWLNGMVTNNIAALKPGEGCYNFLLNAQGRIQGDCTAWMMEDSILLETARDRVDSLIAILDQFIIMDEVELRALGNVFQSLVIAGPKAASKLIHLNLSIPSTAGLSMTRTIDESEAVCIIRGHSPLVPRFELWSKSPAVTEIGTILHTPNVVEASPDALEQLRILSGTPLYGVDIRDKDLPQETNQIRALHFAKGCYLGQEIVERIRSRGAVHRTFTGFILQGDLPPAGTILTADAKPIGELTSITSLELPGAPQQIALGYIRREALERNATITYPGGTAIPTALPFQLPELRA